MNFYTFKVRNLSLTTRHINTTLQHEPQTSRFLSVMTLCGRTLRDNHENSHRAELTGNSTTDTKLIRYILRIVKL